MKLALLVALVAALAVPAAEAASSSSTITGVVGPGFTITVTKSGAKVTRLKAGTYTLVVKDKSSIHDFHITGPGVNKTVTSIGFVGTKTITLKLKAGTYKYICDPHQLTMHGAIKVS